MVGQMLDYAANGIVYWPSERLRSDFETRCAVEQKDAAEVFRESLGEQVEQEPFWADVEQNLRSGRVRLVFVADSIPPELRRVIEFLNERMSPTEVVGVEIKQYVGDGGLKTLVPRVVGQTEQARIQKIGPPSSRVTKWSDYESQLPPTRLILVRSLFERMEMAIKERGLDWTPVLRSTYFGFQRSGGYQCAGADIRREAPVDFWVKLPLSPEELRDLGHDIPDLYPGLRSRWDAGHKQWRWAVPTAQEVPDAADIALAIEIARSYQPVSGPMASPAPRSELSR